MIQFICFALEVAFVFILFILKCKIVVNLYYGCFLYDIERTNYFKYFKIKLSFFKRFKIKLILLLREIFLISLYIVFSILIYYITKIGFLVFVSIFISWFIPFLRYILENKLVIHIYMITYMSTHPYDFEKWKITYDSIVKQQIMK